MNDDISRSDDMKGAPLAPRLSCMKDEIMVHAGVRERTPRSKPAGRAVSVRPSSRRDTRSRAARIFPVSNPDGQEVGRAAGGAYLNDALNRLGLRGNVEAARITGVSDGLISKYRRGLVTPTNKNLDKIVSVIVPLAQRMGIPMDPVEFFVKFGLIRREQIDQAPVESIYVELVQLDREAGLVDEFEQQVLRRHVQMLVEGTRKTLQEKRAADPGTGRKAG